MAGGARKLRMGPYFSQAKYRSGYLLYFLPLQASKFLATFQMHPEALTPFVEADPAGPPLRILDLGAGPGTASLALILELVRRCGTVRFPKLEFVWLDASREILADGKAFLEQVFEEVPALRERIRVITVAGDWLSGLRPGERSFALVLLGNVLNELSGSELQSEKRFELLAELIRSAGPSGTLMLEPAEKISSQTVSRLRNRLFDDEVLPRDPSAIWGPCLHAGVCPLAAAKDWCHISVPVKIPGKWFLKFSKGLGSEREWLKYSYLWLASPARASTVLEPHLRRVVSDPMRERDGNHTVLLCEPDNTRRLGIGAARDLHRGDLVEGPKTPIRHS
jgi:ribosomal protein RSM22 (predicted rRNA methylase)